MASDVDLVGNNLHAVNQVRRSGASAGRDANPKLRGRGRNGIVSDQGIERLIVPRPNPASCAHPNASRAWHRNHDIVVGDGGVLQGVTDRPELQSDGIYGAGDTAGDGVAGDQQMVPGVPHGGRAGWAAGWTEEDS